MLKLSVSGKINPEIEMKCASQESDHDSFSPIPTAPVPVPTVVKNCDNEETKCTLICDGNIEGATPVNYTWKSDDRKMSVSSKENLIMKTKVLWQNPYFIFLV